MIRRNVYQQAPITDIYIRFTPLWLCEWPRYESFSTTKQPLLTTSTNSEAKAHTLDVLMQVKEVSASVGSANAGVVSKVSKVSIQQRLTDGG